MPASGDTARGGGIDDTESAPQGRAPALYQDKDAGVELQPGISRIRISTEST